MRRHIRPAILLAAMTAMTALPLRGEEAAAFESEPVLAAATLVSPALLAGPGYRVEAQVPVVGFMARFTLLTDDGPLIADSIELLEERAIEMAALNALDTVGHGEAFLRAAADSAGSRARAVTQVVRDPLGSIAGLPAGVLRYFQKELAKWGGRFRKHGDRIAHGARNDGDPEAVDGPMTGGRAHRPPRPDRPWYASAGREVVRQAEDAVSHGSARRALARHLGIDPYTATRNPALNERLDRLAWSAAAGQFGVDQLLGFLPAGTREAFGQGERVNELVWSMDPEDLRARNREVLERWCGDGFQLRRFIRHRAFLASVQTRLVDALDALAPRSGCEHLLDLALAADHDVEARFMANALRLAGGYLGEVGRGAQIDTVGAGLTLATRDGRLVLPLPIDFLSWTETAAGFFEQPALSTGPRLLLLTGTLSDRALRELTRRGWEVVTRVPYAVAGTEPATG
ncbi:hypothetical protein [Pseudofulvimonas gallinarii]|uniref:Uncharacterized protein n=1 Tax=Pseudofulvimonas gallinarii TaxID=634155 RepID=A0A4S3KVN8_9GAMM|nr:hypothetical protein [Pseudofulvimonas gallinarii]TCS93324.1 hypothetical protein EDC25_1285 [Pseudofulvimonas gallinarii]THD13333.1 hypothetical protein B1808_08570 [Pseudofulvimonas gallinarii]